MIEKVATASHLPAWRWPLAFGGAALLLALLTVAFAGAPYLFQRATLQSEVATQIRQTTGLSITNDGHARFDLLPRPHVAMTGLHVSDPSGTLAIDADALDGDVRFLPLLVGRIELASATLVKPRLTIDLDGRPMQPTSTIGRALHAGDAPKPGGQRLGTVVMLGGSAVLKSKRMRHPLSFEGIDVTIDWRDLDSPATLTGTMKVQKTVADIAAWIAEPSSLMRGERSAVALRIHSTPLDLTANGDLSSGTSARYAGRVAINAPSLARVIALGGWEMVLPAPLETFGLSGDAAIGSDADGQTTIDLPNLRLRTDGNDYEGTLAYQGGVKPILSGTLATEQLSLAPFFGRAPVALDAERHWAKDRLALAGGVPMDLDLRISATHLRAPPFAVDDAALAVMTRESRTEVGLIEGKAYGGALRGRLSFGIEPRGLSVRGAGSLADADAGTLGWDAFGRQVATGTLTGSASFETVGDSPAELMSHLQGWAKGRASGGELSGTDLGRGLREAARRKLEAVLPSLRAGRTPFSSLAFDMHLLDGTVTIDSAAMQGPDATLSVEGDADLAGRALDLHALVTRPPAGISPAIAAGPSLRINVRGSFDKIVVTPDLAGLASPIDPAVAPKTPSTGAPGFPRQR